MITKIEAAPYQARIKTSYRCDNIKIKTDARDLILKISKGIRLSQKTISAKKGDMELESAAKDVFKLGSDKIINELFRAKVDSITVSGMYNGYWTSFEMSMSTNRLDIIVFEEKLKKLPRLEAIINTL